MGGIRQDYRHQRAGGRYSMTRGRCYVEEGLRLSIALLREGKIKEAGEGQVLANLMSFFKLGDDGKLQLKSVTHAPSHTPTRVIATHPELARGSMQKVKATARPSGNGASEWEHF